MKIILIGYGKMGKTIERIASERGHRIVQKIDIENKQEIRNLSRELSDVAIEFSRPDSAFYNVSGAIRNGIPTLSGTTGWHDRLPQIQSLVDEVDGTFLYASNFSLGVNVFFEMNKWLANKMTGTHYDIELSEIHHTEKLDSPSGTAISLAEDIIDSNPEKKSWSNQKTTDKTKIGIFSTRESNVLGTHTVEYSTAMESIEIKHTAHSRDIFASGVVDVAEWIIYQKGYQTMSDYLNHLR